MKYNRFEKFKVLKYWDKLEQLAKGEIVAPETLVVYPSNVCNYQCGHCIMVEERKDCSVLPKSTMGKLVEDCKEHGIKTVIFSGGGEPLTNPNTAATIETLYKAGIKTGLNTNGFMLKDARHIDYCRISIDAATAKTYKKVKGVDGWDRINTVLRGLDHNELGLAFLINPDNAHEIYQFCEWAQQFKYDFLHIRPAFLDMPHLHGGHEMKGLVDLIWRQKEEIEKTFDRVYFRADKFEGYWTPKLYTKCRSTPLVGVMNADGRFSVCQDNFIKFGDYNNKSFSESWFSEEHKEAINRICLNECPRCVNNGYNEIIEQCVMSDSLRAGIL